MARPIPEINLRDISRLAEEKKDAEKTMFDRTVDKLTRSKSSKNLLLGTASGWAAGLALTRAGRAVACALGGGVLLLHFAQDYGLVLVNWQKVRAAGVWLQDCCDSLLLFVSNNSCFSVGFVGGLFFGIACA